VQATEECINLWKIEPGGHSPQSKGICRHRGEKRLFKNSMELTVYDAQAKWQAKRGKKDVN